MAPEQDLQKRVGRKLTKRRKPIRASSVQYPERLKEGDDAQEDVTAAKGKPAQYMNQSVFSMIAAAGSKTDFHGRFEGEGSDSEDEQESLPLTPTAEQQPGHPPLGKLVEERHESGVSRAKSGKQHAEFDNDGIRRSLPKLKLRTAREKNYMSQSILLPPKEVSFSPSSTKCFTPRDAPVMSKMLEAQADLSPLERSSEIKESSPKSQRDTGSEGNAVSLATRLMEIFGFRKPEEVVSGKQTFEEAVQVCRLTMCQNTPVGFSRVFCSKVIYTSLNTTSVSLAIYLRNQ